VYRSFNYLDVRIVHRVSFRINLYRGGRKEKLSKVDVLDTIGENISIPTLDSALGDRKKESIKSKKPTCFEGEGFSASLRRTSGVKIKSKRIKTVYRTEGEGLDISAVKGKVQSLGLYQGGAGKDLPLILKQVARKVTLQFGRRKGGGGCEGCPLRSRLG